MECPFRVIVQAHVVLEEWLSGYIPVVDIESVTVDPFGDIFRYPLYACAYPERVHHAIAVLPSFLEDDGYFRIVRVAHRLEFRESCAAYDFVAHFRLVVEFHGGRPS